MVGWGLQNIGKLEARRRNTRGEARKAKNEEGKTFFTIRPILCRVPQVSLDDHRWEVMLRRAQLRVREWPRMV